MGLGGPLRLSCPCTEEAVIGLEASIALTIAGGVGLESGWVEDDQPNDPIKQVWLLHFTKYCHFLSEDLRELLIPVLKHKSAEIILWHQAILLHCPR